VISKLIAVAFIVVASLVTGSASAGQVHFAGLPAKYVKPSTPTTGTMVVSLYFSPNTTWNVYADGRVIWQRWGPSGNATVVPSGATRFHTTFVQQRLTVQGVQLLQSKILATGLFDHDLTLRLHHGWVDDQVRVGDQIVSVNAGGLSGDEYSNPPPWATAAQLSALAWLEQLVTDPAKSLPTSAWADPKIRAFIPARYVVDFDRSRLDPSKLPPLARKAYFRYYVGHGCLLTTAHTRALLNAFVRAGLSPGQNHADSINFNLVGSEKRPGGGRVPSDFHFSPALPDSVPHC
jgi:hypothetical protein